jgi:hypothetical protein
MPQDEIQWPKLTQLFREELPVQRRLLRLHEESGFEKTEQDRTDTAFRVALDQELGRISELEFRSQCLIPGDASFAEDIPHFRELVQNSAPFAQYLNFYLYFNVRFAAGRLLNPCADHEIGDRDCNETIAALPSPPLCDEGWDNRGVVEQFLQLMAQDGNLPEVRSALRFLDGFSEDGEKSPEYDRGDGDPVLFELWLRRLFFKPGKDAYFDELRRGLTEWALRRFQFYTGLEEKSAARSQWVWQWKNNPWKEGLWTVNNPLAARCALVDFYWLAKILRADVSREGEVRYQGQSWLSLLATWWATDSQASDEGRRTARADLFRMEEVLRTVFGYACDVIQNAVEIAEECEAWRAHPEDFAFPPAAIGDPGAADGSWRPEAWREVEDQEHIEIEAHRKQRLQKSTPGAGQMARSNCPENKKPSGWSRRVWTGEQVDNLFGLAFSGGGIRSATFNLGVLERLQELDLLRQVDYLSTVSGGGYIGAWLIGNVRRTRYWLSRMTSWDQSIAHLRRYSNYLAPHTGVLSPDSWSMWLTSIRNAFLIQITGLVWLAMILMFALDVRPIFEWISKVPASLISTPQLSLVGCMAAILLILVFFLSRERIPRGDGGGWIFQRGNQITILAAALAWVGSFITAALLWGQVGHSPAVFTTFSGTLQHAIGGWPESVVAVFGIAILILAVVSLQRPIRPGSLWGAFWAVILVPLVTYLAFCAQLRIFGALWMAKNGVHAATMKQQVLVLIAKDRQVEWEAFAIGPSMSMLAMALAIVVFIGLVGRSAPDWTREWWTRYGAWIAMIGAISTVVAAAAVLAPWAILQVAHLKWQTLSGAAAWIGSVVSGLMAGRSSKTGEGGSRPTTLQWVARIGGFLFIVGAVAVGSTLIYLILREALGNDHLSYAQNLDSILVKPLPRFAFPYMWLLPIATGILGLVVSNRFDLNTFGLNQFYRNRLVRCYLGATRWQPGKRHEHPFTGFDGGDDILLSDLRAVGLGNEPAAQAGVPPPDDPAKERKTTYCGESFRGPFPIINCTLNLGGSSDLTIHTRQSASFAVTPLFGGAERKKVGYAPTINENGEKFADGVTLGEAISVSGAAASPNMGYNTSPLVSFMMTLFNVRLGWWFPNPARPAWCKNRPPSGRYLLSELLGLANEDRNFVNVSDGGHFENLGVYELVRRRARVIIASDAECDEALTFGSLGNLVRICETDFGAQIELDVVSIRKQQETPSYSRAHCAVGKITYSNGTHGYLIYLKSSLTGDEDIGVAQYQSGHPTFPHESTGNQFYTEDQFEAYRRLGNHIAERTFRDAADEPTPFEVAAKLFDVWAPASFSTTSFLRHSAALDQIVDRFRSDPNLQALFDELTGNGAVPGAATPKERAACLELIQLMENVFLDLQLDDFWQHPDNRGWVMLFNGFARSPKFRETWNRSRSTFGIRFEYFCSQRLGLDRDRPIIRP